MAISEIESNIEETAKRVYKELGAGHQEAIYREAMSIELQDRGYIVKTEMPVSIKYTTAKHKKVITIGDSRVDLYVEKGKERAIIELKAVKTVLGGSSKKREDTKEDFEKTMEDVKEYAQLQKYLQALSEERGFLINFPFPPMEEPEIVYSEFQANKAFHILWTVRSKID